MADATSTNVPDKGAESPTTARPIEFDDEQQETGIISSDGTTIQNPASPTSGRPQNKVRFEEEEAPPTKPPRPMSPQQQNEAVLIEAFPSLDTKVIKAVLTASGGQVEPAFNALLGMSDPDFQEEAPPVQPARPTAQQRQLQQDEMYARQLAEHYNRPTGQYAPRSTSLPQQAPTPQDPNKEYSFFDDELPEIRENLRQGFMQTQSKVNQWISDFRKRIDGQEGVDNDDDDLYTSQAPSVQRQNFGPSQSEQLHGIQRNAQANRTSRRSTDRERYDDDPQILNDNFTELELRDNEDERPPTKPARPTANPNLFKPTPSLPPQSGPVDEIDAAYGSTQRQPSPGTGSKSKWQPLTSVAPNPDPEVDDPDPFSLGDSDDDRDAKSKDIRAEDTERLKRSANEAANEGTQTQTQGSELSLGPAERSGSTGHRNKEAEDLMK